MIVNESIGLHYTQTTCSDRMTIMDASFQFETDLWNSGIEFVVGIDEVGRGAWAGPVVVGAVIFPPFIQLNFALRDSKKLSPKQRQKILPLIQRHALAYSIGAADSNTIDAYGIVHATQEAMKIALNNLSQVPEFHLVDAFNIKCVAEEKQKAIIGGDALSNSIAAAAILAKEYRDALMSSWAEEITESRYGFGQHKGYGTKQHQEAIQKHGVSHIHRKSFVPRHFDATE